MKMGFRGTRKGMTERQKEALRQVLDECRPIEFHHGNCVGADAEAHAIVWTSYPKIRVVIHLPTNQKLRACGEGVEQVPARGYTARNRELVKTCDMVVAATRLMEEPQKSGTWAAIRYARIRQMTLIVLEP